jgi:hypothetical protein
MTEFNGLPMMPVLPYLDREKGKPAWIIGGGPSLLAQDPRAIGDGVVIAINFSIWARQRLGFPEARYWIFGDLPVLWRPGCETVNPDAYPDTHKFVTGPPAYMLLGCGYTPDIEGLGRTFMPFFNSDSPIVARQAPYLWTNASTLNAAISLAWLLGCDPINIRGADFGLAHGDGRLHWYDPPGPSADPAQTPAQYERMRQPVKFLINCIRSTGVTVTAEGDRSILEA